MVAIRKTIEAIRGIERWGASDMMNRAFQGFVALEHTGSHWSDVLGVARNADPELVKHTYKQLRSRYHPDNGGDPDKFNAVLKAWEEYNQ